MAIALLSMMGISIAMADTYACYISTKNRLITPIICIAAVNAAIFGPLFF